MAWILDIGVVTYCSLKGNICIHKPRLPKSDLSVCQKISRSLYWMNGSLCIHITVISKEAAPNLCYGLFQLIYFGYP